MKKKRRIIHIRDKDDLVIHLEDEAFLLTKARFVSYSSTIQGRNVVTFEGISLRTIK